MKKIFLFIILLILLFCNVSYAQKQTVLQTLVNFYEVNFSEKLDTTKFQNISYLDFFLTRLIERNFTKSETENFVSKNLTMNLKHWFGQSVLGRKYFRTFKKEFMTPYNYKYSYKQIKDNYWSFKSENAYWNYMEQNYPITLDSIYNVFYQKEAEKIMTRLNKLDVSELIYSLGLLDLETNIQLFTSISDDYKHYSENEIILAKMASARLGDKKSEDYLLSDSVFENFRFDMQINVLTYLCTQNSAYKFVKLLSKNIDYSKIKVELKQRVSRKEWVSTSDSILITTFPKEEPLCYTVIKYLTQQKGRDFFIYPQIKDLENIEDLTYIESEIYDKKIQMAIQLLEQNKGRYILNRKINN